MSSNHSEGRRPTSDPKEIAEREITLWNCDLAIVPKPYRSPLLHDARLVDYKFLTVRCTACRNSAHVPLTSITCPDATPLNDLVSLLRCTQCGCKGSPTARILGLTKEDPQPVARVAL